MTKIFSAEFRSFALDFVCGNKYFQCLHTDTRYEIFRIHCYKNERMRLMFDSYVKHVDGIGKIKRLLGILFLRNVGGDKANIGRFDDPELLEIFANGFKELNQSEGKICADEDFEDDSDEEEDVPDASSPIVIIGEDAPIARRPKVIIEDDSEEEEDVAIVSKMSKLNTSS